MIEHEIGKDFDNTAVEEKLTKFWEESGIYKYDENAPGEVFSIDTPPPYVSAAHLHVGHAMSYSQAEFIVRYQRMQGKKIYYPMGFDDNGLPTERYVEQTYKINKSKTTRSEFRKLCLEETARGAVAYEKLWRGMGLSVDWRLRYSTIDEHCQRTAQLSFIDLFKKERIYRSDEPVLWDVHFETALAQADLETLNRKGKLYDIQFKGEDGTPLMISTTRPELIPACVGMYCHPDDERYKHLIGKTAIVPLFDYAVPIKTSEDVDPAFGTGLMMCCTFGDGEDVKKWKLDKLETRLILTPNGRMNELAGEYEGLQIEQARSAIVKDLKAAELVLDQKTVDQAVSIAERSGQPVEFMMTPQWFIKMLDQKEEFLKRSDELGWFPDFMKVRLADWVNGLKYDWNISRQRFYGVPFPVWFHKETGEVILADAEQLPVDPLETEPPAWAVEKYGRENLTGDPDVMDTWMTSSLTPLINSNWANSPGRVPAAYPMTIRVQAFEIIRTWLFYTLAKSHNHTDSLPWKHAMISGWGLNEQGKKVSKRDLEQFTDANGYNRYNPDSVIGKFGADALRYWAAGSHLGYDLRYNEKDVKDGRKLVVKLWNAARFVLMQLKGFDPKADRPKVSDRTAEDRWLLGEMNSVIERATKAFDKYDYAAAREVIERFFWGTFCDDYLEIVKDRFWKPEKYDESARESARATLWESLRALIGVFAPFIPFVTEELYQEIFKPYEDAVSLHVTAWPAANKEWEQSPPEMELLLSVLRAVRGLRTAQQISQTKELDALVIDLGSAKPDVVETLKSMETSLQAVARVKEIRYASASNDCDLDGVKLDILAA